MEKLKTAEIVDAVLILEKTDGQRISINLEDLWREIFLEPQKAEVQRQTREEEKKLQENVSMERLDTKCSILGKCERLPMVNS